MANEDTQIIRRFFITVHPYQTQLQDKKIPLLISIGNIPHNEPVGMLTISTRFHYLVHEEEYVNEKGEVIPGIYDEGLSEDDIKFDPNKIVHESILGCTDLRFVHVTLTSFEDFKVLTQNKNIKPCPPFSISKGQDIESNFKLFAFVDGTISTVYSLRGGLGFDGCDTGMQTTPVYVVSVDWNKLKDSARVKHDSFTHITSASLHELVLKESGYLWEGIDVICRFNPNNRTNRGQYLFVKYIMNNQSRRRGDDMQVPQSSISDYIFSETKNTPDLNDIKAKVNEKLHKGKSTYRISRPRGSDGYIFLKNVISKA